MVVSEGDSGVCLAELIAALSLGTDLGLGHPMEHVLRQCVLALGLGERCTCGSHVFSGVSSR